MWTDDDEEDTVFEWSIEFCLPNPLLDLLLLPFDRGALDEYSGPTNEPYDGLSVDDS